MRATVKAVLWGFFGIRSRKGCDEDRRKLKVRHVIAVGIMCALFFVMTLFVLVKIITAK